MQQFPAGESRSALGSSQTAEPSIYMQACFSDAFQQIWPQTNGPTHLLTVVQAEVLALTSPKKLKKKKGNKA